MALSEKRNALGNSRGVHRGVGSVKRLKAPFPWFGGKGPVVETVWDLIGDVDNAIEPFAGSGIWTLARPHAPRIETLNDMDCYVANFWRATKFDPDQVVEWCDWPVSECDLHAVHRWLVLSEDAAAFRKRMREEPDYFDAKVAGRWCWGLCQWIGSGWCQSPESADWDQMPKVSNAGQGKGGPAGGSGKRRPQIGGGANNHGQGVHAKLSQQVPGMIGGKDARGINGRPQLADAYSRGRGVHNDNHLSQQRPTLGDGNRGCLESGAVYRPGTCAERRDWLLDWFGRLRDRLRTVRVCCGHWLRVCDSESVTTRLGTTGIFFDPPYGAGAGRDKALYAVDSLTVAEEVRKYCLERGSNQQMRIVLAGYSGEGHEELEKHGWGVISWESQGGYGNRNKEGNANKKKERLWYSPACCQNEMPLFGDSL